MQKDFHLGITFVLSRLAGFSNEEANTIASSAQYVDDAVFEGILNFDNDGSYEIMASAHRMLDYRNFKELANRKVWLPFHFIPGNLYDPQELRISNLVQRLVCRPNSPIAHAIVDECLKHKQKNFHLHLLGIAMHTYADTWAHQGFAGIAHKVNEVNNIYNAEGSIDQVQMNKRKKKLRFMSLKKILVQFVPFLSRLIGEINPIGHGTVLSYPDLPYLVWSYEDWRGEKIIRNNPKDFLEASCELFKKLKRYKSDDENNCIQMQDRDLEMIQKYFTTATYFQEEDRLNVLKEMIISGQFSFGNDLWDYQTDGANSWLFKATNTLSEDEFDLKRVQFKKDFLSSDWKNVHDALFYYRFHLLNSVLPQFELCAV